MFWSNVHDVMLLFLYYYFRHQHRDQTPMNIHRNWQYQISYRYKPSVAQQSMNHRPLSFEHFHRANEFSMVDIDFYIQHDPNRNKSNFVFIDDRSKFSFSFSLLLIWMNSNSMFSLNLTNNFVMIVEHCEQIARSQKLKKWSREIQMNKFIVFRENLRSVWKVSGRCSWIARQTSPIDIWTSNCIDWLAFDAGWWIFNVIKWLLCRVPLIVFAAVLLVTITVRCCCCCWSSIWFVRSDTYL